MRKQYTFQRVLLSAYDTQLVGKYSDTADTIMVEIDSSLKSFSIQLPDFMSSIGKQFAFKNLGANAVTLLTKNGQYIDYPGTFTKLVAAYSFYSVASNAFDKWLSLETNATLPPSAHALDSHSDWKPYDSVNAHGQMIACNSSGLWQKLQPGSAGQFLKMAAGSPTYPVWAAGDVINVKDYGATGDGVTDDTAAINDAIAVAVGLPIFFPDGHYRITSTLTWAGHSLTIMGPRNMKFYKNGSPYKGAIIYCKEVVGPVINVPARSTGINGDDVVLDLSNMAFMGHNNLSFDGADYDDYSTTITAFVQTTHEATPVKISGCQFGFINNAAHGYGLYLGCPWWSIIEDSKISHIYNGYGIYSGAHGGVIGLNVTLRNLMITDCRQAFDLYNSRDTEFNNCLIETCIVAGAIRDCPTLKFVNLHVEDCGGTDLGSGLRVGITAKNFGIAGGIWTTIGSNPIDTVFHVSSSTVSFYDCDLGGWVTNHTDHTLLGLIRGIGPDVATGLKAGGSVNLYGGRINTSGVTEASRQYVFEQSRVGKYNFQYNLFNGYRYESDPLAPRDTFSFISDMRMIDNGDFFVTGYFGTLNYRILRVHVENNKFTFSTADGMLGGYERDTIDITYTATQRNFFGVNAGYIISNGGLVDNKNDTTLRNWEIGDTVLANLFVWPAGVYTQQGISCFKNTEQGTAGKWVPQIPTLMKEYEWYTGVDIKPEDIGRTLYNITNGADFLLPPAVVGFKYSFKKATGADPLEIIPDTGEHIGNMAADAIFNIYNVNDIVTLQCTKPGYWDIVSAVGTIPKTVCLDTTDATTKDLGSIVTEGGIAAELQIRAGTAITAGTSITATLGNITATDGDVVITDATNGVKVGANKVVGARGAALTAQLTSITYTAPGTPDYALQDLTDTGGFGFKTKDEGNSVLAVILNLQTRMAELEARLSSSAGHGLFT